LGNGGKIEPYAILIMVTATLHMTPKKIDVKRVNLLHKMRCPALGVSVAFLNQPALPGEAPQTKQNLKKFKKFKMINKISQINQK
jgi:hypothetical protein